MRINSIRTKMTLLTVIMLIIALALSIIIGASSVRKLGSENADEMLINLCRTGEKNLDSYFESVEQSVEMVSSFVNTDLEQIDKLNDSELKAHMNRTRDIFAQMSKQTNGVFTYYYRIDPDYSKAEKGFWYVNLDGKGFTEHEPTDISKYNTNDTSQLVWFTVPKTTRKAIWLPPYITDTLYKRVLSYNEPIYWKDKFIGVVGIEIDYSTMADEVNNIRLYDHGYAFINDNEGNIIYHPEIDVLTMDADKIPAVPDGLLSDSGLVKYTFNGTEKEGAWLPLENGMRLNVCVPVAEINSSWHRLVIQMICLAAVLLLVTIILTLQFAGQITKPLQDLTQAAEQLNEGNYDISIDYEGNDEVGVLSHTVNRLVTHLKKYIGDLNDLAYADALTSVHNKGAFDKYIADLQIRIDDPEDSPEFAVAIFDCDDLKQINDNFGHGKGDVYLKNSCSLICRIFSHSPVFRTGGDEFAVVMQKDDYRNRDELMCALDEAAAQTLIDEKNKWDQIRVSGGLAVYDPEEDTYVDDVVRRADKRMYDSKLARKTLRS